MNDWKVQCSKGHMFLLLPRAVHIHWDWVWIAELVCPVCGELSPIELQSTDGAPAIVEKRRVEELGK